ncbi:MAG: FliG C-terminal domain-containing protein [Pseudomonadota bacterium]
MALPATTGRPTPDGILRSAKLLRALGPRGADVWAELPQEYARQISDVLETLADDPSGEEHAAQTLLDASLSDKTENRNRTVWSRLANADRGQLVSILEGEHPQLIAFVLGRLPPLKAADIVRHLPSMVAIDVLQRMLHTEAPHPEALKAIETVMEERVNASTGEADGREAALARIFEELDPQASQTLLSALQTAEPESGGRIETLMFGFEDLANLPPAGIQTLLTRIDRKTLTLALSSADEDVSNAIFANMTSRARDMLKEEMATIATGSIAQADQARTEMVRLARALIASGDILTAAPAPDDLIE